MTHWSSLTEETETAADYNKLAESGRSAHEDDDTQQQPTFAYSDNNNVQGYLWGFI